MHWSARLKLECKRHGWGPKELSDAVPSLSYALAKKYFKAKVEQPRGRKLQDIADALGLRLQWLRDGTGPRYITGHRPPEGLPPYAKSSTDAGSAESGRTLGIMTRLTSMLSEEEEGTLGMQKMQYLHDFITLWAVAPPDMVKDAIDFLKYKVETSAPEPTGQGEKLHPR